MRQSLLDLYEIQKIDLGIREQEQQQAALPTLLNEIAGRIDALNRQLQGLAERRDATLREATAMRGVVEAENLKIRKWESRLNDIRNQREYQALSRETEGSRRANRAADEKIGELLGQHESLEADIVALRERLAGEQRAHAEEEARVKERGAALSAQLTAERSRRTELLPTIPRSMTRKYDAIRAKRLGIGLCPVTAGCCQGCHMRLPPQLYNVLQRGDTVEQCPSCFRLIFWDQILPAAAPDADADAAAPAQPPPAAGATGTASDALA